MTRVVPAVLLAVLMTVPSLLQAHALEPGFLSLAPAGNDRWQAVWRVPQVRGQPMVIEAVLPETCAPRVAPGPMQFDGRAFVSRWVATCAGGLEGGTVAVRGLEATRTDVLVRYSPDSGAAPVVTRLTPDAVAFDIARTGSFDSVLSSYFALGVEHILEGFDHLLFVFALLLLIPTLRMLVAALTSFTLAHSLTMAGVTLGMFTLPAPPVEAVIALSIVFLATELARPTDSQRLTTRYPWLVSFSFGLLHGFGFAGALREIGLPAGDVPLALLSFNLGVEAGQIAFVVAVVLGGYLARRAFQRRDVGLQWFESTGKRVASYAIGGIASFWLVERVAGFWV
ncbi:HupE/UreJ family protein [Marinobacter sp. M216]|uniref:HupE/UreJ family protein n=1 Tax=Marinobacter albus TaxID=3030833 RepID=A0ABT7HFG3_9GAMM|nr:MULTISPECIES: HupE/UreJ family protein [unclassified Marinobacter]MBW7471990.1 HupE/UreJ family protein [Marinobacter sp. F4218]MDK9558560.1 HupE/UreJ family protein [Marinobacter sp. M216]